MPLGIQVDVRESGVSPTDEVEAGQPGVGDDGLHISLRVASGHAAEWADGLALLVEVVNAQGLLGLRLARRDAEVEPAAGRVEMQDGGPRPLTGGEGFERVGIAAGPTRGAALRVEIEDPEAEAVGGMATNAGVQLVVGGVVYERADFRCRGGAQWQQGERCWLGGPGLGHSAGEARPEPCPEHQDQSQAAVSDVSQHCSVHSLRNGDLPAGHSSSWCGATQPNAGTLWPGVRTGRSITRDLAATRCAAKRCVPRCCVATDCALEAVHWRL